MNDVSYDDMMARLYRENLDLALERLNSVFEDGDEEDFLSVLNHLAKAFQGQSAEGILRADCISRYRKLVEAHQGRFETLDEGLEAIGLSATLLQRPAPDGLFVRLDSMWSSFDEQDKIAVVNFAANLQRVKAQQTR